MFKEATKLHLRFPSLAGSITVEDLWYLPLNSENGPSLNDTARQISAVLKTQVEEDFVNDTTIVNKNDELALEIVKEIIADRKAENAAKLKAADKKAAKQKLLGILAEKQEDKLRTGTSEEEIMKMIDELDD